MLNKCLWVKVKKLAGEKSGASHHLRARECLIQKKRTNLCGRGQASLQFTGGKETQNEGIPPRSQCTGGFLSARLEGSDLHLPGSSSAKNPHQPQDSARSSTWHLRPILPQFWKTLWPNPPSKFVYCHLPPLPRCLPPGTTSLVPPLELQDFSKWVLSSVPCRTDPELGVVASPGALGRHFPPPPHWEVPPIV